MTFLVGDACLVVSAGFGDESIRKDLLHVSHLIKIYNGAQQSTRIVSAQASILGLSHCGCYHIAGYGDSRSNS